jgi:hypothetical protein
MGAKIKEMKEKRERTRKKKDESNNINEGHQ